MYYSRPGLHAYDARCGADVEHAYPEIGSMIIDIIDHRNVKATA